MMNSTQVSFFVLGAYIDTKLLKYLWFVILTSLYVLIIICNVLLMVLICVNRSLHEPMYMFLCSLFVNELYGSTGLFPFLLDQILSDLHTVSVPLCFLQVFCMHTYGTTEFTTLAVMSYDRYLAICFPLQYSSLMTTATNVCSTTSLSFSLQLCGNVINKVYCDNYSVVKLACSDTTVNNIYGLFVTASSVFLAVFFILYTYMRILRVCYCGSKQTRQKAVSTCTPHLASLLNFCCGGFFEIVQSRFDMSRVPIILRIFLSLYFLTCQPLFNPLMYGLKMSKIRSTCRKLFSFQR
ncbi:olfactory receptor 11A1-like [Melanotaenia boesemani]|uniref:olfactory receptor 11A1-like n=1 Tax=Melanotaenia boesemani TaxID=1250792 RepID=UPI001C03F975|nr:olfactory receptor 11A1-like [Melanotaenia boesemani]